MLKYDDQQKLKFSDKIHIKYEFLKHEKLRIQNNVNIYQKNEILSWFFVVTYIKVHRVFKRNCSILNTSQIIFIFQPKCNISIFYIIFINVLSVLIYLFVFLFST